MVLARQFLRAVRGRRSQVAFARRLGYASNVAAEWESGRREPSAADALSACANVFSVSRADYERIRELQKQYFREARAIVAGSTVAEVAGLLTLHLAHFGPAW
jgi:transcriptional regulator with XRE-family HTH domain